MSKSQQSTASIGQLRPADPLARLTDEQVLRCIDERTGWVWFYDVDADGSALRHHEQDGFQPRVTARTIVAETVAFDRVGVAAVSRVHLDVRTGDRE